MLIVFTSRLVSFADVMLVHQIHTGSASLSSPFPQALAKSSHPGPAAPEEKVPAPEHTSSVDLGRPVDSSGEVDGVDDTGKGQVRKGRRER